MNQFFYLKKEDHPRWNDRLFDPEQLVPGMRIRFVHCLAEDTSMFTGLRRPVQVLEYLGTVVSTPTGVIPYPAGHYNESNFVVME